jgi:hypothetical protein
VLIGRRDVDRVVGRSERTWLETISSPMRSSTPGSVVYNPIVAAARRRPRARRPRWAIARRDGAAPKRGAEVAGNAARMRASSAAGARG